MEIPYINRELSWLEFNQRVLNEARRNDLPLMERLKFLSIAFSNLDEFFMVRVGGLEILRSARKRKPDPAGLTPSQQITLVRQRVKIMLGEIEDCFYQELMPELNSEGISRVSIDQLNSKQIDHVAEFFVESIMPLLTPIVLAENDVMNEIPSLSLSAICEVGSTESKDSMRHVLVSIPSNVSRFIWLPGTIDSKFILIEDVLINFIGHIFPDEIVKNAGLFRLTRNAEISLEEEGAHDLAKEMGAVLAERKISECVRLDMEEGFNRNLSRRLKDLVGATPSQVYSTSLPLGFGDFIELSSAKGFEHLQNEPWNPMLPKDWKPGDNIFKSLSNRDMLLHHPYDSFEPVLEFIEQAAKDPKVLAIKQTLYRTAKNSRIISSLIKAAENGKQVTVVVELKARFDEARNLERAEELERAGVQIIYGVKGLKTHSKVTLVVRNEGGELKRYVHFGTGNYNEITAGLYTDISYMTCRRKYGYEAASFFNALTGGSKLVSLKNLTVAPFHLRERIMDLIDAEIDNAENGKEARIDIKVNSLQDSSIITALYRASYAGVKIRLNVRGVCCLQPDLKKISKNIKVTSIVDRYLEHSRIFSFYNNGKPKVYISSADLMERSFDRRVELAIEVKDADSKNKLQEILKISLKDNIQSYILESDGTYIRSKPSKGSKKIRAQSYFHRSAVKNAGKIATISEDAFTPHKPKTKNFGTAV
ncbi:MAG: polyphosphate kinase 1 [Verrucomicrobiaceae bacterium]|nr:polyphosphate kinase 1 [Verrucomicrobiaceae bacterium]